MILRRVSLQGCRCFRNQITLGPFSDGINLIAGPNESGKSTVIEAVARALFDRHRTTDEAIRALQPWGTNLAPDVTLEFECDGKSYRLQKRFLNNPRAELAIWSSTGFQRQWEGDEADRFVRELMLGSTPGRGASKPLHWGVAQFLWCIQRAERGSVQVGNEVANRLREAQGGLAPRPVGTKLSEQIDNAYSRYWTPTGQLARTSALCVTLERFAAREAERQEVEQKYREAEDYEQQLNRLDMELQRVEEQLQVQEQRREELEESAREVRELREKIERVGKELELVRKEGERLEGQVGRFQAAREESEKARRELEAITQSLQQAQVAVATARRLEQQARQEYEQAEARHQEQQQELERARSLRQAQQLLTEDKELSELASRLEELERERQELQRKYEERVWPAAKDVSRARQLERDRDVLRAELQNVGVRVRVELLSEQSLTFGGGEKPETYRASGGESFEYAAGEEAVVTVEGVAKIWARSGAEEPARVAEDLRQVEVRLAGLLEQFGADDVEQMDELRQHSQHLQTALQHVVEQIKAVAQQHETLGQVRARQAEVRRDLKALLSRLGVAESEVASAPLPDEAGLSQRVEDAAAEAKRKYEDWQTISQERERAEQQEATYRESLSAARGAVGQHETVMETVLRTEGCSTFEALQDRRQAAEQRAAQLRGEAETLRAKLPDEVQDPIRQLETVEAALRELGAERAKVQESRIKTRTLVERAHEERVAERRVQVREALEWLEREAKQQLRDALATRLLSRLYQERSRASAEPLEELRVKFDRIFRAVCGRDRPATVDPDGFALTSLRPGPDLEPQPIDEFSSGTQEQADLCWRLALGEVYADKFGPQMMVLDDVLVYTDPDRHERVLEVLKIAAQRLQIFLLTSHPHDYSGLTEARFDMAEIGAHASR